jgi:transformer-2 protein
MDPITRLIVTLNNFRESRGFAFITYETSYDANDAIRDMDRRNWDGRFELFLKFREVRVEISKRAKARVPTPGKYLGQDRMRNSYRKRRDSRSPSYGRGRRRDTSYSPPANRRKYRERDDSKGRGGRGGERRRSNSRERGGRGGHSYSPYR